MIILDFHSKTPIYEQIEEQVMLMVRRGVYKPHDRLPSTRSLASELKLNVNTVKRAFQELEAKGVTYSQPGRGVFISENAADNSRVREQALSALSAALRSAKANGLSEADIEELIKCAAGLYKPDSGKVLIDGESTYNSDEVRSRLFFVPDDLFFPVGSTPNSAARFYKDYYPEFSFGNFERMLKLFELDGDAKIRGFSKGMQRQTEIALALASSPKVLLLDECLDGLDIAKKDICKQLFMDYMAQSGCTMLISSHAIADLQNICDRIVLISGKRMQMNCCTDDIPSTWRKFRLQFDFEPTRSIFGNIDIKKLDIDGRSAVVTVCGHIDDARAKLDALEPLFIDEFPMELEEIFLQETEDKSDEISKVFE